MRIRRPQREKHQWKKAMKSQSSSQMVGLKTIVKLQWTLTLTKLDGSGWTSVRLNAHAAGLVPTSYLEMLATPPSLERPVSSYSSSSTSLTGSIPGKKKGPMVAPKRGAKKLKYVEALYDYESRSDAEWSMSEGERFVLVNKDTGDGWADVERGGVTKSVPANYIQEV